MPSKYYQQLSNSNQQRQRKKRIIEIVICVVLLSLATLIFVAGPKLIFDFALALKPGKSGFQTWLDPPIKTTRNYYLFNITNPEKFLKNPKSTLLQIADSRPYAYEVKTNRKNIQWYKENKEMSYEVERLFIRDPILFNPSSINDRGNFVNMVRTLIRSKFERKPSSAITTALDDEPPFRHDPIEILEGYNSSAYVNVQRKMKGPNTEKYGLIYRQNGSRLYNMTIRTDLFIKGQMLEFASEISDFQINSSNNYPFNVYDGLTFPANLSSQPRLNVFNSDFCRPVRIEFNGTVSKFGFETIHKYVLKLIDFNNCVDPKDDRTCPEVDKIDVSKCLSDSLEPNTIFLSKAHFYGSSPDLVNEMNITGFQPSADQHDSIIYFEPLSGTPIEATYRIQMNVVAKIDPMEWADGKFHFTDKKSEIRTLPVFWIEQRVAVLPKAVTKLKILSSFRTFSKAWIVYPTFIILSVIVVAVMEFCVK